MSISNPFSTIKSAKSHSLTKIGEFTSKLNEKLDDVLTALSDKVESVGLVIELDSEDQRSTLAYNLVIVAVYGFQSDVNGNLSPLEGFYCPIILEAESDKYKPYTVREADAVYRRAFAERQSQVPVTRPTVPEIQLAVCSDSIDKRLTEIIVPLLKRYFHGAVSNKLGSTVKITPDVLEFTLVDSSIIPATATDFEESFDQIGRSTIDKLQASLVRKAGAMEFVKVNEVIKALSIESHLEYGNFMVETAGDRPIFATTKLDLSYKIDAGNNISMNSASVQNNIASVYSFIDYALVKETVHSQTVNRPVEVTRLRPDLIISHVDTGASASSLPVMLGIVSAAAANLTDIGMMNALYNNGDGLVGALNRICDISEERLISGGKKEPEILNLRTESEYSSVEIGSLIKLICPYDRFKSPIKIDIIPGMDYNPVIGLLLKIGLFGDVDMQQQLYAELSNETNGAFDANFTDTVFMTSNGSPDYDVLPFAIIENKEKGASSRYRDARHINLPWICKSQDLKGNQFIEATNRYMYANSPVVTKIATFEPRIRTLYEFVPEAKVIGKIYRLTFNPAFINALLSAFYKCNFHLQLKYPFEPVNNGLFAPAAVTIDQNFAGISAIPNIASNRNATMFGATSIRGQYEQINAWNY